ncbi:MAG: ABC transporter ATP-binding protein [Oscillospiraceae bacterium]|nr:ABC transporter ATP-binding protein [Oscillospiraceae bacterium]
MQNIINVKCLKKSYKDKEVVHGIDFTVNEGEILCFLGPNGAGKSTTINIITGALRGDSGNIQYKGESIYKDLLKYKSHLGIVPQDLALYDDLTAEKNVLFFASLYGLKGDALKDGCRFALEFTGLSDKAKDKVNTFSGGMKRRLNIACAIAHKPELLIMDEPTVGIDPQSRNHILEGVKRLREQGMTILYTTHYMEEVEEISTRIIIMDIGNIIAEGTNESLKANIESERNYRIAAGYDNEPDIQKLRKIDGVKNIAVNDGIIDITTNRQIENLDKIISALVSGGIKITDISCQTASLETVFLKMTGKSLRD